jgi:hypothetical protein
VSIVPVVPCLLKEDISTDKLRTELLKINRLFRVLEISERRYLKKAKQIEDDQHPAPEEDPKVTTLRDLAFTSFKTYCTNMLKSDELDITGQPSEFRGLQSKPSRLQ